MQFIVIVNPGLWMTVGEDSVQYRKRKKAPFHSSYFAFYQSNYYNLMASLSRLEALFLDLTLDALNNFSFKIKKAKSSVG